MDTVNAHVAPAKPIRGHMVTSMAEQPHVYVIVLNWNGWNDTIACLESLFRSDYSNFTVVVCDNRSEDDSLAHITAWAQGRLCALPPATTRLTTLVSPPLAKPIPHVTLDHGQSLRGNPGQYDVPLVMIQTGANRGFAGGNNVGLRYALANGDADFVWLLNNDTLVASGALSALVARMQADQARPVGLCGSKLVYLDDPERVQAWGGARFNVWFGTHRLLGANRPTDQPATDNIEPAFGYIVGASMMASREWLNKVGLLCEDYFLYFEEIDWAYRGKGRLPLGYAPDSVVYHKEGATIGSSAQRLSVEMLALRNRLLFTRLRAPWALPTVWMGFFAVLANRIRRGQFGRVLPILKLMLTGNWTTS